MTTYFGKREKIQKSENSVKGEMSAAERQRIIDLIPQWIKEGEETNKILRRELEQTVGIPDDLFIYK